MAKITVEHQEEILTFPPDTILELKIQECVIKTAQGRSGEWQKVEFKFKVLGIQALGDGGNPSDYENWITRDIYGSVPFRLTDNPENKLRMWAEAIFRQELGIGFELDTDMFVGRSVRGITSQYDTKNTDSQGNPFKRHQIDTLLPFGAAVAGTAAQSQQPAPVAAPATPAADPWASSGTPQVAGDPWGSSDEPPF